MQVKIIPELRYRVENERGEHIGDFVKGDKWQGMVRLLAPINQSLIVESMSWTEELLSRIFSDEPKERMAMVVKASPDTLARIVGKQST